MLTSDQSCLDIVERNFRELSGRLAPICLDPSPPGLPSGGIALTDLRVVMLKRQTCQRLTDAVWSHLVRMSAVRPDPWDMAAAGMLLPGLKRIAARFAACYPGEAHDVDSEVLEAFLHALRTADPNQPQLCAMLYRAAFRRARRACAREWRHTGRSAVLSEDTRCPCLGNPDLVLAGAMLDGVITHEQANLVCGVHLDSRRRGDVARRLGISRDRARRELAAAKRGLFVYLTAA